MKVAVYHCLPPGGARRMLGEILRRSSGTHEYELFELDLGAAGRLGELSGVIKPASVVPVPIRPTGGPLRPALDVARVVAAERVVARRIDAGGFDLAFIHPSQFTQAPTVLSRLSTPSIYMIQEPRRRSFEAGYRTTVANRQNRVPGAAIPRQAATALYDHVVGRLDRSAVAAAGTLVCNSSFSAESIARAYGRSAGVCHLGVDAAMFSPPDPPADRRCERPYSVVSVGALDPSKGHDLAIQALALIPAVRRPVLDLVYERDAPGYDEHLISMAEAGGVELRLHHAISDAELVRLYGEAVATVCAAHLEPFGLTPLESISCGTPVAAVREGGYRETVTDGVNGELVERSPEALAAAIEHLAVASRGRDPQAIRSTVIPSWSWDATVARLHELFESPLSSPAFLGADGAERA